MRLINPLVQAVCSCSPHSVTTSAHYSSYDFKSYVLFSCWTEMSPTLWPFLPVMLGELPVSRSVNGKGKTETVLWPHGFWQLRGLRVISCLTPSLFCLFSLCPPILPFILIISFLFSPLLLSSRMVRLVSHTFLLTLDLTAEFRFFSFFSSLFSFQRHGQSWPFHLNSSFFFFLLEAVIWAALCFFQQNPALHSNISAHSQQETCACCQRRHECRSHHWVWYGNQSLSDTNAMFMRCERREEGSHRGKLFRVSTGWEAMIHGEGREQKWGGRRSKIKSVGWQRWEREREAEMRGGQRMSEAQTERQEGKTFTFTKSSTLKWCSCSVVMSKLIFHEAFLNHHHLITNCVLQNESLSAICLNNICQFNPLILFVSIEFSACAF